MRAPQKWYNIKGIKKMRKTIVMMLTLACCLTVRAQQAETIESFIANSHEPEWYAAQAEAWQKRLSTALGKAKMCGEIKILKQRTGPTP